jgi:tetratricopeptide (TPR) repeat protein
MSKKTPLKLTAATFVLLWATVGTASAAGDMGMGNYSSQPTSQPQTTPQEKSNKSGSDNVVRAGIAKPLRDAIELDKNKDIQGAFAKVKETDAAYSDKSPYEEYVVAKLLGQFAGQLHDDATAVAAFNRALASNAAPDDELPQILSVVLALNINTKDYAKAISAGERLQKLGKMSADDTANLALAYYLNNNNVNALKTAQAAIAMQTANGGNPNLQTLQILMNTQVRLGDQAGAKQTYVKLCSLPTPPPDLQCGAAKKRK